MNIQKQTEKKANDFKKELDIIAKHIHWPECWDTMAYPTVADAVCEITMCYPDQCSHPEKVESILKAGVEGGSNGTI